MPILQRCSVLHPQAKFESVDSKAGHIAKCARFPGSRARPGGPALRAGPPGRAREPRPEEAGTFQQPMHSKGIQGGAEKNFSYGKKEGHKGPVFFIRGSLPYKEKRPLQGQQSARERGARFRALPEPARALFLNPIFRHYLLCDLFCRLKYLREGWDTASMPRGAGGA